jgi:hypothetical protein
MNYKTKTMCLQTQCSGCITCNNLNESRYSVKIGKLRMPSITATSLQQARAKAKKDYGDLVFVELDNY